MIRALVLVFALAGGFGVTVVPAFAQTTTATQSTAPAAVATNRPSGGGRKSPGASPCKSGKSARPCPTKDPGPSAGNDGSLYLPPLLADLLGGVTSRPIYPGRKPTDPGPRPPLVGGGIVDTSPTPPRAIIPPAVVIIPASRVAQPSRVPPQPPQPRAPRQRPRAVSGAFVPGEVLAVVEGGPIVADAIAVTNALTVLSLRRSLLLGGSMVRFGIPDGRPVGLVLAQLEADGRAGRPEPNHVYDLSQTGSLPQYAFERIALKPEPTNGENVKVAVIDSAVEIDHPALSGVIAAFYDARPGLPVADRSHGTSIVGLIAGRGAVKGTAPAAAIYLARAFEGGQSTTDAILRSLDWSAAQDAAVINMSFAGPYNRMMGLAVGAARRLGIVLVAAAGNAGPRGPRAYPAAFDSVIAVTATDSANRLMPVANRGTYVFVAAPGVDVAAPVPGGVDFLTGTSMAAAIISGGIAALIGEDPTRGPDWIERTLAATAVDLGPPGRDRDFGFGLVSFAAARLDQAR